MIPRRWKYVGFLRPQKCDHLSCMDLKVVSYLNRKSLLNVDKKIKASREREREQNFIYLEMEKEIQTQVKLRMVLLEPACDCAVPHQLPGLKIRKEPDNPCQ